MKTMITKIDGRRLVLFVYMTHGIVKAVKLQKLLHGYFHSEKSDAGLLETPEVSLLFGYYYTSSNF